MGWTILMVACSLWRRRSRLLDARSMSAQCPLAAHSSPARHSLVTHSSQARLQLLLEQGVEGWAASSLVSFIYNPLYCNVFGDQARFSGGHNRKVASVCITK